MARAALRQVLGRHAEAALAGGALPLTRRGAFVTLRVGEELRGCLGRVAADRALADLIPELAVAAAREDPRFPPVRAEELDRMSIEISVVSAPRPVPHPPEAIEIGRDGLIVERGRARGLLLPQVAPEQGWGALAFLEATCEKAGLSPGAWREPETRVFAFAADVFKEQELR